MFETISRRLISRYKLQVSEERLFHDLNFKPRFPVTEEIVLSFSGSGKLLSQKCTVETLFSRQSLNLTTVLFLPRPTIIGDRSLKARQSSRTWQRCCLSEFYQLLLDEGSGHFAVSFLLLGAAIKRKI